MPKENSTVVTTEFVFVGLTDNPELLSMLFVLLLVIFITTLVDNLGIIALVGTSPRLHTPMYFFLSGLSFLDIGCSTAVTPKTMVNLLEEKKSISLIGCAMQIYVFTGLGCAECFLLAAMAYDRYVTICKPLLYPIIMSSRVCIVLVGGSYVLGVLYSFVHAIFAFRLSFSGSNVLKKKFCDFPTLFSITTCDIYIDVPLIFYIAGLVETTTILSVLISYSYIVATILRIRSAAGKLKAFSTCTSHLATVTIYHRAILILHFRPKSNDRSSVQDLGDKMLSVFYTIVTPLLNPLIYSLRNKDVKDALGIFQRKLCNKIINQQ
ncbi:olfactory receptor 5AR1-like [Anolis sagrei]|uniref:olfactory receptor 5AR1-like n=1 Tax=Anolis sagrei TaxID=38937 RepID=UPI00351FF971